jgi:hypothetical protein
VTCDGSGLGAAAGAAAYAPPRADLVCKDTASWSSGYNNPLVVGAGYDCGGYIAQGWCDAGTRSPTGAVGDGHPIGDNYNNPESNCCACGKALVPAVCGDRQYVGCFTDTTDGVRDLPVGPAYLTASDRQTSLTDCASQCAGYQYMGLQDTNQCYCGNLYGSQGSAECPDDCGLPSSASGAGCGNRNAVYRMSDVTSSTDVTTAADCVAAAAELGLPYGAFAQQLFILRTKSNSCSRRKIVTSRPSRDVTKLLIFPPGVYSLPAQNTFSL